MMKMKLEPGVIKLAAAAALHLHAHAMGAQRPLKQAACCLSCDIKIYLKQAMLDQHECRLCIPQQNMLPPDQVISFWHCPMVALLTGEVQDYKC